MSRLVVPRKPGDGQRREDSLSRDRIVDHAIEVLDESGEAGLTFRVLAQRLSTGPGAIYWHVPNKAALMAAACDGVVARMMNNRPRSLEPEESIRNLALIVFDGIDEHPWVGSVLASPEGLLPMVRILEPLGQQIRSLGVSEDAEWAAVGALLSYILGVGGQNAANGQLARSRGLDRSDFLDTVATTWSQLDPNEYPFARSIGGRLRDHDDRADFLAGIDIILRGIAPTK